MEFNIKIKEADANLVLEALGNLPFNKVAQLLFDIKRQAEEQIAAKNVVPTTEVR